MKVATPLPPLKPSQTGKRWPEEGAERREDGRVRSPEPAREEHGGRALQGIADQGRGGKALAPGAQHVGRADIAGADLADVAEPGEAGQDHAERDRAEEVAEDEAREERRAMRATSHRFRHDTPQWRPVSRPVEHDPARNHRERHLPFQTGLVEGRVLGARAQLPLVEHVGRVGIEHDEVGGRAALQPPAGRPRISAGRVDSARRSVRQGDLPGMDEPQGRRQQGLEADRPVRGLREGQALGLDVLRIVVGHDHVDGAVRQGRDDGLPVVLVAQRRRELQEGAVVADVVLVEREVVDRDAAGDRQARAPSRRARSRPNRAQEIIAAW